MMTQYETLGLLRQYHAVDADEIDIFGSDDCICGAKRAILAKKHAGGPFDGLCLDPFGR